MAKRIILSVNAGSSSVKISVYEVEKKGTPRQLAEAQISGLTAPPSELDYVRYGRPVEQSKQLEGDKAVVDQIGAFHTLVDMFIKDDALPEIKSRDVIAMTAHRVVHGGDYDKHQLITDDTYHHLLALNDLAPLHNRRSLEIVRTCIEALPQAINVAHFDSQFHATIPRHVALYAINRRIAENNRLKKYGFHGISYSFILRSVAAHLDKHVAATSLIALHLGSGASACAIQRGTSIDTSMGLTPLAGLPGATRSGSVDPSLVFHYASDVGKLSPDSTNDLHISRAEEILNQEAGWKSLTGTTNFAVITAGVARAQARQQKDKSVQDQGQSCKEQDSQGKDQSGSKVNDDDEHKKDDMYKLAFDLMVDRICGFVGAYYVALEGEVDALVFAGGIGEKSAALRAAVVAKTRCLGFDIDSALNAQGFDTQPVQIGEGKSSATVVDITGKSSAARHRTLICKTDEQFEMARECAHDESLWQ